MFTGGVKYGDDFNFTFVKLRNNYGSVYPFKKIVLVCYNYHPLVVQNFPFLLIKKNLFGMFFC